MLAMSPVQDVFNSRRPKHTSAQEELDLKRTMSFGDVTADSGVSDEKSLASLALSEIMLTIDIAPSPLSYGEDNAIVELSELLRRW